MPIDRREFLAGIGGLGVGLSIGGISHWLPLSSPEVGPDWSPGREEFIPSTCLLCPAHCGIRGRLVDGKLVKIDGNPLHPVNRGGLCPKGYAGIQMLYHPGRLTGPVERAQDLLGRCPRANCHDPHRSPRQGGRAVGGVADG
jgi:molybdopterin-containing oxidoreductase family iron-sulfur binding subunit